MMLVDSSGWIEYFTDGPGADRYSDAIEDLANLVVPTICIAEVFKFVLREESEGAALEATALMSRARVAGLDAQLATFAATLGVEHDLPLADSIVYATGRALDATILTQDADFDGLPGVRFVPRA